MPVIVTITFNPSVDKMTSIAAMDPEKKMQCSEARYDPGGGGINIARVLHRLEAPVSAIYFKGGHYGEVLEELLKDESITCNTIKIKGQTRENLIVLDRSSNFQYRFNMPGPVITENEWLQCLELVARIPADIIVGSGSLPEGVPLDIYTRISEIAAQKNAKLIVDTSGEALQHALSANVFLVKPNIKELATLTGKEIPDIASAAEYGLSVLKSSKCEAFAVSAGAQGALLITREKTYHIKAPDVKAVSTIGAGDSMVAGIVYGLHNNYTLYEAVRFGVALGSATTMQPGTHLCNAEDAMCIYKSM